tara:strand:+ start:3309 stop:3488 length:180 start_codon:yes stop_codon:yes gene_type:complete
MTRNQKLINKCEIANILIVELQNKIEKMEKKHILPPSVIQELKEDIAVLNFQTQNSANI